MSTAVRGVPVVLAFALAGCTAGAGATSSTTSTARPPGVVVVNQGGSGLGSDLGNDLGRGRPHVTYDGLMVRRRVVIAIHPIPGANLFSLRKELDDAAARGHTSLSSIPPAVLDPALLEPESPAMTLVLPPGRSLAEARRLVDPVSSKAQRIPDLRRYDVAPVLVHDLRFTVSSATPAVLAATIAREGILSDALGNYATTVGRHELHFTYTGPLLSDDLVESVRAGIARRALTRPAAVTISPRSITGVGVDMAKEPALPPVVTKASTAHRSHAAALPTANAASQSSHLSLWSISALALPALLILTRGLLIMRRMRQPNLTKSNA